MKYSPHDYQNYAKEFIIEHPYCCLMLDMGLGKTVVTLTALWELLLDSFEIAKVLVVAPKRVAEDTWPNEIKKWVHLKDISFSLVLGSRNQREEALKKKASIYIINRENVSWLVEQGHWSFDALIIDELSSFKSSKATRFKALKKVRPGIKRVIGLTGTPAPNNLLDLWSEVNLLDMGERLGRFIGSYRDEYFSPDKRNQQVIFSYKPKAGAEQKIYEKISDICISMKACDYLCMPERIDNVIEVNMDKCEYELYKKLEKEMLLSFSEGDIDAVNAAALSNKLMQMANGAVYDENRQVKEIHSRKLDALEDLIEQANGKNVLVFYAYRHDRDRIMRRFSAQEIRDSSDISRWNEGKINIAIAHPASAGHGLNLQSGGSIVIWFGLTWSLELYSQANARLYRQGQKETVVVHHIVTKNTVDIDVMDALKNKKTGQDRLIEAVRARIGGNANDK